MASKSEILFVKSLHQKKYREQHRLFLVEGTKMVDELLHSGFGLHAIYALETYLPTLQISVKLPENINIREVNEDQLRKMSTLQTPNKVLAVVHMPQFDGFLPEEVLRNGGGVLALDGIQDPGNMGTLIRIADWFGIGSIVASENSVEFYNPKVVQASMGSLFRVKLYQAQLESFLRAQGGPVYGAVLDGRNLYEQDFRQEGVLLLGNESKGVSRALRSLISDPVTIPRLGGAESLNVAVAAAVIVSEIKRSILRH